MRKQLAQRDAHLLANRVQPKRTAKALPFELSQRRLMVLERTGLRQVDVRESSDVLGVREQRDCERGIRSREQQRQTGFHRTAAKELIYVRFERDRSLRVDCMSDSSEGSRLVKHRA